MAVCTGRREGIYAGGVSMSLRTHSNRTCILIVLLSFSLPVSAAAQIISVKTVPVATGDQFMIFPSRCLGMGGVSIALDDPLLDPFVNPAKGASLQGRHFFTSLSTYGVSNEGSSGRSFPIGYLIGSDRWFGGGTYTFQQLLPVIPSSGWEEWAQRLNNGKPLRNSYFSGFIGRRLDNDRAAIGFSMTRAALSAVEGVSLLYAGCDEIEQNGTYRDYRLGLTGQLEGERSYELMLLHTRYHMVHDVRYGSVWSGTIEQNHDDSRMTGLHAGYTRPSEYDPELRVGFALSLNVKDMPKIPEYELPVGTSAVAAAIPRDPGLTWAWNLGAGLSKHTGPLTFGVELVFEPVKSNTWAETEDGVHDYLGRWIPPGGKTIENTFKFSNMHLRLGFDREDTGVVGFQLGMQLSLIEYTLAQIDNIAGDFREEREGWWVPPPKGNSLRQLWSACGRSGNGWR